MKNKGFSLVELIVVIAIMAILVGVAVPVYTSYIGKANEAKDAQLLDEINSAFMVAAIDNNIDFSVLTSDNNKIEIDENGKVTFKLYDVSTTDDVDLNAAVAAILPGELTFKTIEEVWYNKNTRKFEENTTQAFDFNGNTLYLSAEDIAKLKESTFGSMGMDVLMGKVDFATQLIADPDILYTDAESGQMSSLGELVFNDENLEQVAIYLGFGSMSDPEFDSEGFEAAFAALVERKAAIIAGDRPIDEDILTQANAEIMANSAVLIAATKSDFDTDAFLNVLGSEDGGITALLKNGSSENAQTALAQSAMAYAMYTAYTTKNNLPVSNDPSDVLNTLENDPNFKLYMQDPNTQADIDGYLAAMNMINDCTAPGNEAAVSDLLVNGFTDEALVDLLDEATK